MAERKVKNRIIICIENDEDEFGLIRKYEDFGITFDSTEEEVLTALRPAIKEKFDEDIYDEDNSNWLFKTRKNSDEQNIYIMPNSTAG